MRSEIPGLTPAAMLVNAAKTNPRYKALIERVPELSFEDIKNLPEMPWVREALTRLRIQHDMKVANANTDVLLTGKVIHGFNGDGGIGDVYEWLGDTKFVSFKGRSEVEVKYGKLFWLPRTGGVWFETMFSETVNPEILANSRFLSVENKIGYTDLYRARINATVTADMPVIDLTGQNNAPGSLSGIASIPGVQIIK